MARGGSKRRTYVRDANGRFASTPGGGLAAARKAARPTSGRKSTLQARSSLKASRAKLAAKDKADPTLQNALSTRAQKGAVTKRNKALKAAKKLSRIKLQTGNTQSGLIKKSKPLQKTIGKSIQLGTRLNPAKRAVKAAKKELFKANTRENRIRFAFFKAGNAKKRAAIYTELNKVTDQAKAKLEQFRNTKAQFGPQKKDKRVQIVTDKKSGVISKNKDVRNKKNRKEAFKKRITRTWELFRPGNDAKAKRTEQIRARAQKFYRGMERPQIADSTIGGLKNARTSSGYKAPSSRIAPPSRAAQQKGRALNAAQTKRFNTYGNYLGNPEKLSKKVRTGRKALEFYANPEAFAKTVLLNRGKAGLRTKGYKAVKKRKRKPKIN